MILDRLDRLDRVINSELSSVGQGIHPRLTDDGMEAAHPAFPGECEGPEWQNQVIIGLTGLKRNG